MLTTLIIIFGGPAMLAIGLALFSQADRRHQVRAWRQATLEAERRVCRRTRTSSRRSDP